MSVATGESAKLGRVAPSIIVGILVSGFILGLSSYPLEEYRLTMLFPGLPFSVLFFIFMCVALLVWPPVSVKLRRDAILSILLFCVLAMSTLMAEVFYIVEFDVSRLKGLFYFLMPVVLVPYMRRMEPELVFKLLIIACVIPVAVGWFRYFSFTGGIASEHAIGYWGIRYLPATRNSDVLYPLALSALSLNGFVKSRTYVKVLFAALFVLGASSVMLSLSRGAWFALAGVFAVVIGAFGRKYVLIALFTLPIFCLAAWSITPEIFVDLIVERALTLGTMGDSRVSNVDRLIVAKDSLVALVQYPFGVGFGNMGWAVFRDGAPLWNSENAWLTIGVEGGWVALLLFLYLTFAQIVRAAKAPTSVGGLLTVSIFVYLIFNYELNSAFMWALLSVCWCYSGVGQPAVNFRYVSYK